MPMTPFMERFPKLAPQETRSVTVAGRKDLPDGAYGFVELYCNEPGCDCRRVIINVLRPETGWRKAWATIGYGWESLAFYRKWGGPHIDPAELKGPYLDPLNQQSEYSPALLDLFRFLIEAPDYVERLQRHYQMFRESVDQEHARKSALEARTDSNRRKRLRDPRRRRRS